MTNLDLPAVFDSTMSCFQLFNAIAPSLGTPVGAPVYDDVAPLPAWITKPSGNDVTVDCLANEIIAITGAASGAYGLSLRR